MTQTSDEANTKPTTPPLSPADLLWAVTALLLLAATLIYVEATSQMEFRATLARHGCPAKPTLEAPPGLWRFDRTPRDTWVCADGTRLYR